MSAISYREDFKCWWPDYDAKPEVCHARVMRYLWSMDQAIKLCRQRRVCVQAGGHAGLWPQKLAEHFSTVWAFEPDPDLYSCLVRNTDNDSRIHARRCVLGAISGTTTMRPHASAGSWRVDPDGSVIVYMVSIDDLALEYCDAIFLDVEGYEVEALRGAAATIERCRPVVQTEMLPRAQEHIEEYMRSVGYRRHSRQGHDAVYVPLEQ